MNIKCIALAYSLFDLEFYFIASQRQGVFFHLLSDLLHFRRQGGPNGVYFINFRYISLLFFPFLWGFQACLSWSPAVCILKRG